MVERGCIVVNDKETKKTDFLKIFGYGCGGCVAVFIIIVFFFMFLSYLGSRIKDKHHNATTPTTKAIIAEKVNSQPKAIKPEPNPNPKIPTMKPTGHIDSKEIIRKIVIGLLPAEVLKINNGHKTVINMPVVRKIDIEEQIYGGYGVFIEYNATIFGDLNDKTSKTLTSDAIGDGMTEIYGELFSSKEFDIKQITIAAYLPVSSSNYEMAYKTMIDKKPNIKWNEKTAPKEGPYIRKNWAVIVDLLKDTEDKEESVEYQLAVINAGTYISKDDITVNRFRYLLGRICTTFKITKTQAGDMTIKCCQMLKEEMGVEETLLTIMEGMNTLISQKTKDQKYQDYLALYLGLRNDGKTHDEAIRILQGSLQAMGLY